MRVTPTLPTFFLSTVNRLPSSPTGGDGNCVRRTMACISEAIDVADSSCGCSGSTAGCWQSLESLSESDSALSCALVLVLVERLGLSISDGLLFRLSSPGESSIKNSSAPSNSAASYHTLDSL